MKSKVLDIINITIIGMGALGLLYGLYITKHCTKSKVTFVMDEGRYEKNKTNIILCNGVEQQFHMAPVSLAAEADLVIVAVKHNALKDALEIMHPCIGERTVILSVLNGISSEEIIGQRYGMEKLIFTVAQGMDAMKFGNSFQYTRMGELHIGAIEEYQKDNLKRVKNFFELIKLPYVEESDIRYRMWSKFMLNVGVNQTCMVYGTNYAGALREGEPNRTMISAMREVIALANAEGIPLSEKDINQYVDIIKTLSPEGTPSMGQDRINKNPSEVEIFAGTVIRLAKKWGIYIPVNQFLYNRVKQIETEYI